MLRIAVLSCFVTGIVSSENESSLEEDFFNQLLESLPAEPRRSSQLLTLLQTVHRTGTFDFEEIQTRIRERNPHIDNLDLFSFLTRWRVTLQNIFQVPEWFHFLHLEFSPYVPPTEEILAYAPENYPIRDPESLNLISAMWSEFGQPCIFERAIYTHGELQPGYRMVSATQFQQVLERLIQLEMERLNITG
jgi:hypothetical protein